MGWNWYLSQFAPTPAIKIEATPDYVVRSSSLEKLHRHLPNAHIVVVLRDPLERAISAWKHWSRLPPERQWHVPKPQHSFVENVEAEMTHFNRMQEYAGFMGRGFYELTLRRLHRYYPAQQVHVLFLEDLMTDSEGQLQSLLKNLQLPGHPLPFPQVNVSRTSNPTEIPDFCLRALWRVYHAHNKNLERYLGRKTPWLRTWAEWSGRDLGHPVVSSSEHEIAFLAKARLLRLWATAVQMGPARVKRLRHLKMLSDPQNYMACVTAAFSHTSAGELLEMEKGFSNEEILAAMRAIAVTGKGVEADFVNKLRSRLWDVASCTALSRLLIENNHLEAAVQT